jgi:hypothetical protein
VDAPMRRNAQAALVERLAAIVKDGISHVRRGRRELGTRVVLVAGMHAEYAQVRPVTSSAAYDRLNPPYLPAAFEDQETAPEEIRYYASPSRCLHARALQGQAVQVTVGLRSSLSVHSDASLLLPFHQPRHCKRAKRLVGVQARESGRSCTVQPPLDRSDRRAGVSISFAHGYLQSAGVRSADRAPRECSHSDSRYGCLSTADLAPGTSVFRSAATCIQGSGCYTCASHHEAAESVRLIVLGASGRCLSRAQHIAGAELFVSLVSAEGIEPLFSPGDG